MLSKLKISIALFALGCIAIGPMSDRVSAITAEVAKKCHALSAKAFPPRQVGNPAAGSAKGSGKAELDYFRKCVANGGTMSDDANKKDGTGSTN